MRVENMNGEKTKQDINLEELYEKMQDKLKKYIQFKIENTNQTNDILQDVFLTTVEKQNELPTTQFGSNATNRHILIVPIHTAPMASNMTYRMTHRIS
jgi:hypothetical protein